MILSKLNNSKINLNTTDLIWLLIPMLFSCCISGKNAKLLVPYQDWKNVVSKKIEPELAMVCEKWPKEWEDCPDGKYEWEAISAIDIAHNIFILDSLRNSFEIKGNAIDRMIVIHEFDEGFNSWYRETFLIKKGKKWLGVEYVRFDPPGSLKDLLAQSPRVGFAKFTREDIQYYLRLKSGTFAFNGGIKIITFLVTG